MASASESTRPELATFNVGEEYQLIDVIGEHTYLANHHSNLSRCFLGEGAYGVVW